MIRGVRIHEFVGPEVLRIEEVEIEEPGAGEVRIRIRAIGINRTEITLRSGTRRVQTLRDRGLGGRMATGTQIGKIVVPV